MKVLRWTPRAIRSMINIQDYIAQDNRLAAFETANKIYASTNLLHDHPLMGRPGKVEGTRELVVLANYIVVYRVKQTEIEILRVMHAAQRWPQRF